MIILQVVPELKSGGVERGTVDFALYLTAQGHRSIVVSAGGTLVARLTETGAVHYTLPVHQKSLFSVWTQAKRLAQIIRKEKVDIVHARSRVPAWSAYLACRWTRTPFLTTCHGVYKPHGLSRVMGWGRIVISISHAVSRHVKEKFAVPEHRIRLIHRGVNLDEFVSRDSGRSGAATAPLPESDGPIVGIVGRITPLKGHRVLIRAWPRIRQVLGNARLWIVGESPRRRYTEELQALAEKLGVRDSIEFLGTRQDVPAVLSRMSVLAAPAVGEEAFGRVLIEAGACGVPVIASRIGGIVDVVDHGVNGLLVPAGDAAALSEAVIGLVREKEYAAELARNLKKKVHAQFRDVRMFEETVRVYREVLEHKKILVLKLSALGDVILSTPSFRELRHAHPNARIAVCVGSDSWTAVKETPFVDEFFVFDSKLGKRLGNLWRLGRILAKENFDLCVDLQNNRLSRFLAFFAGIPHRIGFRCRKWDFLVNDRVRLPKEVIHPVEQQFLLLRQAGAEPQESRLELQIPSENREFADAFLRRHWVGEGQILIGLHPGSSAQWLSKQWPKESFAELCRELSRDNVRIVLTGTHEDIPAVKAIAQASGAKPIIAAGETRLMDLAALIARMDVLVASDTAPLHLACALGTPFVALFGPTDPKRHLAHAVQPHAVLWKDLKCSPCYLKKCPIGHPCMKNITPAEVAGRVRSLIATRKAPVPSPGVNADPLAAASS